VSTTGGDTVSDGQRSRNLRLRKRFIRGADADARLRLIGNLATLTTPYVVNRITGGGVGVRTYIQAPDNWIWMGCALMALGGLTKASDRVTARGGAAKRSRYQPHEGMVPSR